MTKVFLEVKNCGSCPNHTSQRFWTSDSFDTEFIYHCKAEAGREIGVYNWREERDIKIPTWCPLRKQNGI